MVEYSIAKFERLGCTDSMTTEKKEPKTRTAHSSIHKEETAPNMAHKVVQVIDCLFDEQLSFNDIKKRLGLPNATLHRILAALEGYDFVERNTVNEKYNLGIKFIYYGQLLRAKKTLVSLSESVVNGLSLSINESVCLSVLYNNQTLTLISTDGEQSALTARLVPVSPLNCSASGKLYLSLMEDDALRRYFASDACIRKTSNSICTFEDFKEEQKKILSEGVSYDNEEFEYGLYCMATQLSNHEGPINASIGLTGPTARIHMKDIDSIKVRLLEARNKISEVLRKIEYQFEF